MHRWDGKPQACGFLLKNTNLTNWYHASESRQLVILGDMSFGNSVTMTFLVDELSMKTNYLSPISAIIIAKMTRQVTNACRGYYNPFGPDISQYVLSRRG